MTQKLFTGKVWNHLTVAARNNPEHSYVAVAYFGADGAKLLPLASGSYLAVNASEAAVKAGQTCPAALIKLQRRGVRIFNVENLHAKLFVFGEAAFIGSANASNNSANNLVESIFRLTAKREVSSIRDFIQQRCCLSELQPDQLSKLRKLYRPPKFDAPTSSRRETNTDPARSTLRIAKLRLLEYSERITEIHERGLAKARENFANTRNHAIDDFHWTGRAAFRLNDNVIRVTKQEDGNFLVSPPATIIHIEKGKSRRAESIVYLQGRKRPELTLNAILKKLGPGSEKRLLRNGRIQDRDFAIRLIRAFDI